jgi:glycerol kinase
VEVAADAEATALGAAALAGLGAGVWRSPEEVAALRRPGAVFEPAMGRDEAESRRGQWRQALSRVMLA